MKLDVRDLGFAFPNGGDVFQGISFALDRGEVLSLLGPNGTGKTTLLRCLLGICRPGRGAVLVGGRPLADLRPRELARAIAYVPQAGQTGLPFSVLELALMGRTAHLPPLALPTAADRTIVERELDAMGIGHLAERSIFEISGGERQLALIARALAQEAPILVMDEPTASLDYGNQVRILRTVREVAARGIAVLMTTHAPDHAFLVGGNVALLKAGRLAAIGSADAVVTAERLSWLYDTPIDVVTHAFAHGPRSHVRLCAPRLTDHPPRENAA